MKTTPLLLAVMTFALNLNAGADERLAACRQQINLEIPPITRSDVQFP
jgi:hypothetical protein